MDRYTQSFVSEIESFINAVLHDDLIAVNGDDARIAVVMALAARKSYDERRAVRLEEIGEVLPA